MSTSPGKKCGKTAGKKGKGIVSKACVFCGLEEDNEELLGKRIKGAGLTVHNFCMLLSSGLCQRGTDKQGLLGFMPKDIQKEVNRGKKLSCSFCKQKGATVGCVVTSCRIKFHLHCGRNNGTLHQFFGRYQSFCPTHRPRQATLTSDRLAFFGTANTQCSICMCAVEARASNETLRSPCCRSSWFHRNCIQRLATTAGLHYLKCPLCNNRDVFQEEMLEFGIHIPDQDAAWELDPNAYQDLLERYSRCDAHKCCCPRGREYNKDLSKWEILVCVVCGSQGCHVECGQLPSHDIDWTCPDCEDIAKKVCSEKKTKKWKSKCDKKSTEGSLKAELRKEYERLQEKAKNFQSPPKPSASPEGSPGTSGCSSSKGGRYKSSPRGKRYREKVLRSAIKESDTRREEDSSSSDDDLPLKSPPKARRKLRSRKTRSTTISVQVSMSESEEPAEGRAKSPAEREGSVSGSPKGSMHFEMAEQQPIKRRKRKKSMWSRGKYVVKQSTVKKRKLRPRSDSCSSGNAEVASLTSPKRSIGGSKSLVLSPAVIERIRAPSASFNSPDSDIAEDIDELEVVSSTDVEKTNVQQRRILRNYQKKNYKDGKTYARKSEKHQDSDKQSWGSLDMSLLDMVTLSEDEAPSEGEISASAVVSSTITGDPLPRVDTEPLAALSPLIITPLSWRPTPCNTEPEFIDLEDAMAVSSETAPNQDTATAETSGQGSEPRPTMLTKNRVFTEEIQTISSSSSAADDEDDEVVFVRAENTRQPHRYNGYVREWVNAAQVPQPNGQVPQQNGSTMGFHSIMTSRGLKLISTRCPPPIQPQAGPYTTSVMTPRGLRLVSSHPSHPPGNPIYHSAGYQYLSSIGNRWVPASTLSSHPSVIGGPYVNHSTNVVNNGGQINTTGAPSPAYVNTVAAAQKPSAPQLAKNTQNPQSAVVIDLTDSILEDTASDEIPNSEIQSDHNSTSQQPVPVGLFYNNNESESSKSPLKINKDALQTIRSVVVNKNGLSHPNENNRQMDSDKESLSGQSSDKGLNVRRKGAKLSLRKHAHKDAV